MTMAFRHVVLMLVLVMVAWEQHSVDAECCNARGGRCWDCTRVPLQKCCGLKSCNIFCCNCDKGANGRYCREGTNGESCKGRRSLDAMLFGEEDDSARRIVRAADLDQDGRLNFEEAHAYLTGSNPTRSKRELYDELDALDVNMDQYLTAEEIDPMF